MSNIAPIPSKNTLILCNVDSQFSDVGCGKKKVWFMEEHHGSHICTPSFNKENCNFDGGDCCLPIIDDKYCPPRPSKECNCHEDDTRHISFTESKYIPRLFYLFAFLSFLYAPFVMKSLITK